MSQALEGKLVISICAGVTMAQLKSWVPPSTIVVRAMPNTPCKVGSRFVPRATTRRGSGDARTNDG